MTYPILPGQTYPLGAQFDGSGTNFALFSANATRVELCLFDVSGMEEIQRLNLPTYQDQVFCGYVPNLAPGTLYGYRCYGPYEPEIGQRFNPNKLLLDPYARKLSSALINHPLQYDYTPDSTEDDLRMDGRDSAPVMPKCIVTTSVPDLPEFTATSSIDQKVIYELHPLGFTKMNSEIAESIRGTYHGLASDESIAHLQNLGITTVELLPIHASCAEPFLRDKGLENYWGYNNYHYFVFQAAYAQQDALEELRYMTQRLHAADIEVIIDVVYNHTAEGGAMGPTHSFRGIDNRSYYLLNRKDPSDYWNFSGCGNSVNLNHPRVLQLVMDSLRYLITKVGADGFRFDLASSLGRGAHVKFSAKHPFFSCIKQDPLLSKASLIAEPWDIGRGGYQLGNYPHEWWEWNDRFRDSVRRFWRGDEGIAPEFASRLHGSGDFFGQRGRSPYASVNFITAHDGFTLYDLVSYEKRHNQANLEDNRDGHSANFSANHGHEGETADLEIKALRLKQQKNMLASLLLAQGTPMLLAGDEFSNSQQGNNNAYCQNNSISWLDWSRKSEHQSLFDFCQKLINLRKNHPLLNRPQFSHGQSHSKRTGLSDISWLNTKGKVMKEKEWQDPNLKSFAMMLASTGDNETLDGLQASCSLDDALLIIFNASSVATEFSFPMQPGFWREEFNTAIQQESQDAKSGFGYEKAYTLEPYSSVMFSYLYRDAKAQEQ